MSEFKIIFPIDNDTKIIIGLEEPIEKTHCCYEASIALYYENSKFNGGHIALREYLLNIKNIAENVAQGKFKLHESLHNDVGFLLNEELQGKPGLHYVKTEESSWWIGYTYCLSLGGKLGMWLYNNQEGNSIFEATPIYPFSYRNYEKDPGYIPYKKWIKGYEPYCIIQTTPSQLEDWVRQANVILGYIEKNMHKRGSGEK